MFNKELNIYFITKIHHWCSIIYEVLYFINLNSKPTNNIYSQKKSYKNINC